MLHVATHSCLVEDWRFGKHDFLQVNALKRIWTSDSSVIAIFIVKMNIASHVAQEAASDIEIPYLMCSPCFFGFMSLTAKIIQIT